MRDKEIKQKIKHKVKKISNQQNEEEVGKVYERTLKFCVGKGSFAIRIDDS